MSFSTSPINNQLRITEVFILATAVLVTLATLGWLLIRSHYGIDLTDESHYLIWMADPWLYSVSVTQFGFIYHPLYLLLQGDISLLRQANILIIFGLAAILCLVFFRATLNNADEQYLSWRSLPILALAAITATCSLIYFCPYGWLATPSYNSLIFQALLVASIGLLLAQKSVSPISITGWILIGVGGWLAFMAKPTSAVALGLVISVCLPLTGKFNTRLLSISLLTALILLIASAWVIDGSVIVFIERLRGGLETVRLLDAGQIHMFRIDDLLMPHKEQYLLIFATVITFVALFFTASEKKISTIMGLGFVLLFTTTSLAIISGYLLFQTSSPFPSHSSLLILAVPLSTWFFGFTLIRRKVPKIQWGMALYFAVLPHVLAFGTNNNYWQQGSLGSLFWVLAGLVILMPFVSSTGKTRILLPTVVSGQLITVFLLYAAMEHPYFGQPEPFRQYDDTATTGIKESTLILPKELADYYLDVKKMAINAGFQSDTPVIDMTGDGSGVLYAINAKAIGSAWMIGGFTGSDNMAKSLLNRVPCTDITNTWLLVAPDSPLKLSPTILNSIGLSFEKNFEMAAELNIPSTQLARRGIPAGRLQLWKPKQTTQYTIPTCEKERNAR